MSSEFGLQLPVYYCVSFAAVDIGLIHRGHRVKKTLSYMYSVPWDGRHREKSIVKTRDFDISAFKCL